MDDDGGDEAGGRLGSVDMGPLDWILGLLEKLEEEQVMDTLQPYSCCIYSTVLRVYSSSVDGSHCLRECLQTLPLWLLQQ